MQAPVQWMMVDAKIVSNADDCSLEADSRLELLLDTLGGGLHQPTTPGIISVQQRT
jgi:hypothetical protein